MVVATVRSDRKEDTPLRVIACECGTKIRVRNKNRGRALKCPACDQGLALDAEANVLPSMDAVQGGATCQICQTEIAAGEGCVECPACDQTQHRDCWAEVGGCGTYGCKQAPSVEKTPESADAPLTARGDTKDCPACGEEIKSIALRCRYCDTEFNTVDPMSLRDLARQGRRSDASKQTRSTVTGSFVLSLIGCLAPIMLFVWAALLVSKREQLKQCGPQYPVMAWAGVGISVIYTILLVGSFLLE